ncbi:MAG: antibiotic biosynthesis monooxygenase family protein [Acidimicrobiales bacterium]
MDEPVPYTLAVWRVKAGCADEFVQMWTRDLAGHFLHLERRPQWGRLLRSVDDPQLFYSFGPWQSRDDIVAMRSDLASAEIFARLAALCDEFRPGLFEEVARAGDAD